MSLRIFCEEKKNFFFCFREYYFHLKTQKQKTDNMLLSSCVCCGRMVIDKFFLLFCVGVADKFHMIVLTSSEKLSQFRI